MPEPEVIERAKRDKEEGKSPSTQAGEFVREEMHHIREGKHGAANTKQAIAIGLSKARRAGVELSQPSGGNTSERTRKQAQRDSEKGPARKSKAVQNALESGLQGIETRRAFSSFARKSIAAGQERGAKARGGSSKGCCATGSTNEGFLGFAAFSEKNGSRPQINPQKQLTALAGVAIRSGSVEAPR
jgi:hypothetical protein